MKKNYLIYIFVIFCTFSCLEDITMPNERQDTDRPILIVEKSPHTITYTSATLSANIESANGYKISARGFIYGSDNSLEGYTDSISIPLGDNYGIGNFEFELKNLTPGTKYYYMAFATNNKGTQYSEIKEFSTWTETPIIETGNPVNIYAGNATISGVITFIGAAPIEECGICYSLTSENPVYEQDNTVAYLNSEHQFEVTLNKLAGSQTYYIRSYAKNSYGIAYGQTKVLQTPAIWEKAPSFIGGGRISYTTFTISDNFYVVAGESGSSYSFNDVLAFNVAENKWENKANFPRLPRKALSSFVIEGKAYIGLGISDDAPNFICTYHHYNNAWGAEMSFSEHTRAYACSFSINNNGYVVGGRITKSEREFQTLSDVWKYESDGNNWKPIANFPVPIHEGISFVSGDKAFVGLGACVTPGVDVYYNSIWEYDLENDSWKKATTVPDAFNYKNGGITGVTVIENNAYIIDGNNYVWVLNLDSYEWTKKSEMHSDFKSLTDNHCMFAYRNNSKNEYEIFTGLNHLSQLFYKYRPEWDNPVSTP